MGRGEGKRREGKGRREKLENETILALLDAVSLAFKIKVENGPFD